MLLLSSVPKTVTSVPFTYSLAFKALVAFSLSYAKSIWYQFIISRNFCVVCNTLCPVPLCARPTYIVSSDWKLIVVVCPPDVSHCNIVCVPELIKHLLTQNDTVKWLLSVSFAPHVLVNSGLSPSLNRKELDITSLGKSVWNIHCGEAININWKPSVSYRAKYYLML